MNRLLLAAMLVAVSAPALAQNTAVGQGFSNSQAVGTGIANSRSQSGATAIGGGNATGGNARSSNNLSINSNVPANTASSVTSHLNEKNVPAVFAPGLTAAGIETCLGSVSGGGAAMGWGFSFGSTVPDVGCQARLDARTLWAFGLKAAAVARMCQLGDVERSMPTVCAKYAPRPVYAQAAPYAGGPIELVEGSTGKVRMCNVYDAVRQRCRVWAKTVHLARPLN